MHQPSISRRSLASLSAYAGLLPEKTHHPGPDHHAPPPLTPVPSWVPPPAEWEASHRRRETDPQRQYALGIFFEVEYRVRRGELPQNEYSPASPMTVQSCHNKGLRSEFKYLCVTKGGLRRLGLDPGLNRLKRALSLEHIDGFPMGISQRRASEASPARKQRWMLCMRWDILNAARGEILKRSII